MGKVKKFKDFDYISEEDADFKVSVREAEKQRQADRKNKRREKRSYLDEEHNDN